MSAVITGQVVSKGDPVQAGRDAWQRIKGSVGMLQEDWRQVAAALDIGRQLCITANGGLNKKAFGQWCASEGFSDIDFRLRADALWMLDNLDSIIPDGDITINNPKHLREYYRKLEKQEHKKEKAERKASVPKLPPMADRYQLHHCSCSELADHIEPESQDWIITDPPYPKEYLNTFSELSELASRILKPGGLVICMSGQSWLPEVMRRLGEHLNYHWCGAYLTPGGQSAGLHDRRVNTFWKPILIYSNGKYSGPVFGDVSKSDTNDNDKDHHHWGQSVSGMRDLVNRFTMPGDTVVDPFLGGGTTCLASLITNRLFIGCDVDNQYIDKTRERISEI